MTWSKLACTGYIPEPREGHAAALVDDILYVFSGRDVNGTDLADIVALRITGKRTTTVPQGFSLTSP